jgi:hypothetical protein
VGMYRKAMSMNVAEGDDSHHGRCDDGKELLCPSGRKTLWARNVTGVEAIICEDSLTGVGVIPCGC